jgi:hypothetical protein
MHFVLIVSELIIVLYASLPNNGFGCAGMINFAQYGETDAPAIIFEISRYFSARGKR